MTTNIGFLMLITFNIFLGLGLAILWIRALRPAKEDPRLSRGLQLLQSKIAILEDLSDRTDNQVKQLVQILDERAKLLRTKILNAEETMLKIEQSMGKSLEVAKIFQDKIPHEEIIERNQTSKYVMAAQLANEGRTVDEIVEQVNLPRSEVEFIAKVNRDELTFNPELLPEWAKTSGASGVDLQKVFQEQKLPDLSNLRRIEADFKTSVREQADIERRDDERRLAIEQKAQAIRQSALSLANTIAHRAEAATKSAAEAIYTTGGGIIRQSTQKAKTAAKQVEPMIRKVQFPRINIDK